MLNNNLADALQSIATCHRVENDLKALAEYNEALKVCTSQNTPVE
jgi:hypothetical protein